MVKGGVAILRLVEGNKACWMTNREKAFSLFSLLFLKEFYYVEFRPEPGQETAGKLEQCKDGDIAAVRSHRL